MTTLTRMRGRPSRNAPLINAGETVLTAACLRVLLAVCQETDATGRATIRTVAVRLRQKSSHGVHRFLRCLRDAGLVEWEPRRGGSLRPTTRVVLWRDV
jgi:SOS-response transcriptional repressor LexA